MTTASSTSVTRIDAHPLTPSIPDSPGQSFRLCRGFSTERTSFAIDHHDVPGLRTIISRVKQLGYAEAAIRQRLGLQDLADLQWRGLPMYRKEHLTAGDPLALLIDLFLLQGTLRANEIEQLFAPSECELLTRTGLLAIDEMGRARSRASLFPVADHLIFSDHAWPELPHPGYAEVPPNQVMFVGGDSRTLVRCTRRRPVRAALDLCTGSGVQALFAAAHSEHVVAVDINPRAVRCAHFNAQVSGITNLNVLVGDLFEPVRTERFDLIVANPPFVPSPLNTLMFRDGGPSGEDVQRRIVAGLPNHLAPGGIAHIITELGQRDGEPLVDRVRQWLNGAPMDIHVFRFREYSAMKYAIGHAKGNDYDEFLHSVDQWASNLRNHHYARVVVALLSFQWSDPASGPPWSRVEESQPPQRAAGAEIEAAFAAERIAHRHDWRETIRHCRLRCTGPIALLDAQLLGTELRANAKATLLGQSLTVEHQLDRVEREILNHVDGLFSLADISRALEKCKINREQIVAGLTSLVRRRLITVQIQNESSGACCDKQEAAQLPAGNTQASA
jgi:methylase of polypeptide subunit release factors